MNLVRGPMALARERKLKEKHSYARSSFARMKDMAAGSILQSRTNVLRTSLRSRGSNPEFARKESHTYRTLSRDMEQQA